MRSSSDACGCCASSSIEPEIDAERVADLVRDAGGELADGGEPLGAAHVRLEAAQLRQVLEVDDAPITLIADVAQRRHGDAERRARRAIEVGAAELALVAEQR